MLYLKHSGTSICLSLISEQSDPHTLIHTHPYTHKVGVLICPTDSAVSETGCQREGIYYRIDLAMQLGGNGNFSFHFSLSNTSLWGTLKKGWSDVLWWLAEEQKKAGLWAEGKGTCVVLVLWQISGHFYSMEEQKWNSTWLSPSFTCSFSLPVICNRIKVQNKNKLAILILVKKYILNIKFRKHSELIHLYHCMTTPISHIRQYICMHYI